MDKLVSREVSRSFNTHGTLFSGLGADALAGLATANSDIAIILSPDGVVLDIAYRDRSLKAWHLDDWIGQPLVEIVTVDSRVKIGELLRDSAPGASTRVHQVNHPAKGVRDLPVGYRLVSFAGSELRIALGTDMRAMAEMQQRLVRAQIDMEKDYRKLRDIESRYRILFHLAAEPLIVVDARSLKIVDANDGAARLLDRTIRKIVGMSAATLFAKADQAQAVETLTMLGARGRADVFRARPATDDRPMEVRVTPFREFGKTNLLVCFASEDEQRADAAMPLDNTMISIVDSLPEGIVVVDDAGNVVEANPGFLDLIRVVSLDRVERRSLDAWLGGSPVDLQVLMANLREHGTVRRFASVIRDELGGTETVEVSAARIAGGDGPLFGFVIREAPRGDAMASGAGGGQPATASQFTDLVGRVPLKDLVRDTADIIEKLCIEAALRLTDNNRASAADMLGLSRQSLYIKLKRYGISDQDDGDTPA
ncbi:MAG: transcriptional regulator PpsR [Mesorhizobium sp.]|nr:transcriptional regulator PpsR [Mesorhizobium sp.]